MMIAESLRCYTLRLDTNGRLAVSDDGQDVRPLDEAAPDAGAQLVKFAQAYQRQHRVDFTTALKAVREFPDGQNLVRAYGQQHGPRSDLLPVERQYAAKPVERRKFDSPDAEIERRAEALIANGDCKTFKEAVRRVIANDHSLAGEYVMQANERV